MKTQRIGMMVLLILAGVGAGLFAARYAPNVAQKAQAQELSQRFAFTQGIGFYYYTKGQMHWLGYPGVEHGRIRDECFPVSAGDFKLFTYGLDFSRTAFGLPPHLMDMAVLLYENQYNLDDPDFLSRNASERKGPYPVHFIPRSGYEQPVYEITCDLWDAIKKKEANWIVWGFKFRETSPSVYWFAFRDEQNKRGGRNAERGE